MNPEPHPVSSPSKAVDVIAVLDAARDGTHDPHDLYCARLAVAELVAAAKAFGDLPDVAFTAASSDPEAAERFFAALSTIGESQ